MNQAYEAPELADIGTVQELTMQFKNLQGADGVIFQDPQQGPVPIGSA